jgi:hypothetical protein
MPAPAPWGLIVGTVAGGVPTTVTSIRDRIHQKKSKGWVSIHQRITRERGKG